MAVPDRQPSVIAADPYYPDTHVVSAG
ncbi:hypothetical protein BLAT2472_90051 [Burkholderia latens]